MRTLGRRRRRPWSARRVPGRRSCWRYSGDSLRRASSVTARPAVTFGSTSARSLVQNSSTSHGTSSVSSMTGVGAVIAWLLTVTLAPLRRACRCARQVGDRAPDRPPRETASRRTTRPPCAAAAGPRRPVELAQRLRRPVRPRSSRRGTSSSSVRTSPNDSAPRRLSHTYGTRRAR